VTPDTRHEPHPLALLRHELLTLLNAVLGYADAWRMETFGPLPQPYKDQAVLIHAAAGHLLAVVDAMISGGAAGAADRPLALARLSTAAVERLLTDVVGLLAPRARSSDLQLRTLCASAAGVDVQADPVALTQVLINLIDNAVKFAAPGGTVTIGLDWTDAELRLTVENRGGPPPAVDGVGSGLGLGLALALTEAMGGSLTLDVSSGEAARAVLRLPTITAP
jgi:two-component system cell cycle sensor histidine kinase PleC